MTSFIKIKLFSSLNSLSSETRKMIKHVSMFNAPLAMINENIWRPPTDVFETKDKFIIRMEISGMKKDNFEITLCNDVLTIAGQRPLSHHGSKGLNNYTQMEIHYGYFEKIIFLPEGIDQKKIKADYQNGFLKITLLKTKKRAKSI